MFCSALIVTLTAHTTYADDVSVSVSTVAIHADSDFYQPLSPYGRWQVVGSDGSCWIPGGVASGWSPYSNGYWQQTDAGWYWASDEPWAWATYHYGGWGFDPQFGWYWVPQTQWAPAWVSWREGGGYVGWAPLGPSGRFWGRSVTSRGYVTVEERRFLEPVGPKTVVVDKTAINKTVINKKGPAVAVIEKASGRTVQAVPVRELRNKEEAKVVAQRATPTSTTEKAVQTPARSQAEKPAITTAAPQPPAARNEVSQADEQSRVAKLDAEKRAQQEKAGELESEKKQSVSVAVQARPEAKPEAKVESKPVTERPAATREPEQKAGKDDEKKD
ncbi:MAG: DUF6600 domain-containing protein [Verrucomicrobiia bacterium]